MISEFFIDDVRIKDPLNLSGFYLTREVSPRFNGNVYDQLGRVESSGNVIFDDRDACHMLKELKKTYLTEAKSTLSFKRAGYDVFSTNIDFSSMRELRNGTVEATFQDYDANVFIRNVDTPQRIALTSFKNTSSDTIYTGYSMSFDKDKLTIEVSGTGSNRELSPIPTYDNKAALLGSLVEMTDFDRRPFYKNSTGQKIRLNMNISVLGTVEVSGSTTFKTKIVIKDPNGAPIFDHELSSLALSAGSSSFGAIEQVSLDVPTDCTASFLVETVSNLSLLKVVINDTSTIQLSEGDLSNMSVPGISVADAIREAGKLASDGLLEFVTPSILDEYFLTSYGSIRGRETAINISFGALWDDINAMFCLKMDKIGGKMVISGYPESFSGISPYRITDVSDYSLDTDFENLYASINMGFQNWKPDNDGGVSEPTAPITVSTSLPSAPSTLDLVCGTLSASRKMISEAYLMKDRQTTETDNNEKDSIVFIIPNFESDIIDSVDSLSNWSQIIGGYHKTVTKSAGEGKYMNTPFSANLSSIPAIFAPDKIIFSCNMSTLDFNSIGSFVEIVDIDRQIKVYVNKIIHYPFAPSGDSQGNTAITGRVINQ